MFTRQSLSFLQRTVLFMESNTPKGFLAHSNTVKQKTPCSQRSDSCLSYKLFCLLSKYIMEYYRDHLLFFTCVLFYLFDFKNIGFRISFSLSDMNQTLRAETFS